VDLIWGVYVRRAMVRFAVIEQSIPRSISAPAGHPAMTSSSPASAVPAVPGSIGNIQYREPGRSVVYPRPAVSPTTRLVLSGWKVPRPGFL
jgi:hypothetical protein